MRLPNHIGIIPDGNRRWAVENGMSKEKGYDTGISPGLQLLRLCKEAKIKEVTYYGFTVDNTKRPKNQRLAFTDACIKAVESILEEDVSLLVVGNTESDMFPKELLPYTKRKSFGRGGIKVNFLVNYGWEWDLNKIKEGKRSSKKITDDINSSYISRIDLIIRWGGRRRLSGFLPVQSIYSDFYVIDDYWPDFKKEHFLNALDWYNKQDVTLGG
ncbi:polyprenyl diphosphate synthase [Clostridium felsineum]|uniref:Ditrans,polycis-undecaprenyl-diphosphate synthase ((2E,6E)-farnesyl-diphosphate specific) n=1 Tax=Clostridium felsineum TaxID=36839 RepID=A0A1S8MI19_9CLOT|nr:polyprenyl diphosphate synthase [Clostridium felsineum]MCR3759035.1 di-trans,poly-cis-decaprenylcistransferase [Clostridium felsineum]URZ00271.1 Ditrans,polycis-undecaprenyl-diphosphate synthase ((2E,6E)-farnesyl-diphosphate specific) [Clostridium felsineum]URZ07096.1 Ditrans,polycis-undecaprenyl-diphosphate synthase ((2E,6E)-farnesyl-diphosphate specific) [Clostridium felsineum]URZ12126.1 Ditrans,polycis-undecaprenyl-diphosphate synthase ((2E,6E)-farnesyl-diphosphate specific) [Clostridium 